jgi:hypothetical protein
MLRRLAVTVAVVALGALVPPARADELPAGQMRAGAVILRACGAGGWCRAISRPLDPARPTGRRIKIAFKWFDAVGDGPLLVACRPARWTRS